MNADDSDPHPITHLGHGYPWIRWSPDGKTLSALTGAEAPEGEFACSRNMSLYLVHTESAAPPKLLVPNAMMGYEWSPDSRWIACPCLASQEAAHRRLLLCLVETNANATSRVLAEDISPIGLSWSPDSKQLAYTSWAAKMADLFVASIDGSSPKLLTKQKSQVSDPRWSPDGKQILFSDFGRGKSAIWMIDPDGSNLRRLTEPKLRASGSMWSPDGKQIAFSAVVHGWVQVHLMNSDGSGLRQVTHGRNMGCFVTKWLPKSSLLLLSCGYLKSLFIDPEPVDRRLCVLDLNDPTGIPRELLRNFHSAVSVAPIPTR